MAHPEAARRLIVNADDFGQSCSVNEAVIRAHREGILTAASLMVNEPGFEEAVTQARENPRLGVGLHLTLSHGHSALAPDKIPGLVNERGEFSNRAAATGWRYFSLPALREQLRAEILAQFEKFRSTGLVLDHVNGHLHFHLHPTVFTILMSVMGELGIQRMRLTRDSFRLNARLAKGRWWYRGSHAFIYCWLSARARGEMARRRIRHTTAVFGLLQNSRVDEQFLLRLIDQLPVGDSEVYSHPSMSEFRHEFDALVSPKVKSAVAQRSIQLIRYQDL